ncbi:MAG: DEAD/DEAH box helicase [Armatimonadetes bacterium]|nr:DEAD/DEAH box helicase [Armatimonadota bacterium]
MKSSLWQELLAELCKQSWYRGQIRHIEFQPAKDAQYGDPTSKIHRRVIEALTKLGIKGLYRHQAKAIDTINSGKHTVIVTGTASGKTLCYNIPVLSKLLEEPGTTALYIFPTKALAQDQLRKLSEFGLGGLVSASTYDGDTPDEERKRIRQLCNLVFTNPDMLHLSMLRNYRLWRRFLGQLKFVVLDEMHIYRGIFGMHVALIIRRLRRLCDLHGSSPIFIGASATVGNPKELSKALFGVECEVVSDDTGQFFGRTFILWEPPTLSNDVRVGAMSEAVRLIAFLMKRGIRTIAFAQSRVAVELLLRYVREELAKHNPKLVDKVISYRAGYLPEERRRIERELANGSLLSVIATTALELGIDIGHLDAAVIVGYPGSIASTMQQVGRAGRTKEGLAILIATSNPLDQYIVNHPEYLFGQPVEKAIVNVNNPYILASHLLCAAYEQVLSDADLCYFGERALEMLEVLSEGEMLLKLRGKSNIGGVRFFYFWASDKCPHEEISIRSISGNEYEIRDASRGNALIGTIDEARAFATVHEGAIYLHAGESYRVVQLDIKRRVAIVEPFYGDEYTVPLVHADVQITKRIKGKHSKFFKAWFGEAKIIQQVVAYKRMRLRTNEVIEVRQLSLPKSDYETDALWIIPDESVLSHIRLCEFDLTGSLHAAEHALVALMPLIAMCDEKDIGGVSYLLHPQTGCAAIFIYDGYPGGAGFSEAAFEGIDELMVKTKEMIESCACAGGCPSCVQSPSCGDNNHPLDKPGAVMLLRWLLGAEAKMPAPKST